MKKLRTFVFSILLGLAATTAMPHSAKAEVSVGFFYDNLSPYGEWVSTDDYGYCWRPSNVSEDWRPYQDGYWAYTDDGWTWVSYEDYGGIVYHYGRWVDLDEEGWVWVPGTEWAPAWVSWRSNDDYVGWAPLPPEAHFSASVGIGFGVDAEFDIGPSYYNFCPVGHFGDPDLRTVIVNKQENVTIINNTTNITNINVTKVNKTVYNGGPNFATISQRTAHPIQRLNLVRQTDVKGGGSLNGRVKGNSLIVQAPQVTRAGTARLAPKNVTKHLGKTKADRGWSGVTDPGQRQAIETKFKTDAKRPKNQAVNNAAAQTPQTLEQAAPNAATTGEGKGKGKGKKHQGDNNLQPFLGGGAAQQPEAAQPDVQATGKKGKKHKDNADFGGAATPTQPADTQSFNPDQPKKGKKNKNNQDDAQAQELKRQRQADQAAQAEAQQEKAARRQAQQDQAAQAQQQEKAARRQAQQEQGNQAAKAERKQEQRAAQQQMLQQQAAQQGGGGGGKGEGKKKKKDKDQDQQDNN